MISILMPITSMEFARTKQRLLDLIDGRLYAECGGMYDNIDAILEEFRKRVIAAECWSNHASES